MDRSSIPAGDASSIARSRLATARQSISDPGGSVDQRRGTDDFLGAVVPVHREIRWYLVFIGFGDLGLLRGDGGAPDPPSPSELWMSWIHTTRGRTGTRISRTTKRAGESGCRMMSSRTSRIRSEKGKRNGGHDLRELR